jgi:precorrin-2 dehydrogenase / sirohydrochlorin ferrochelatase
MPYTPIFADLSGKKVVIFGGGAVGERKARFFEGADVTVVSPAFTPGLESMGIKKEVSLVRQTAKKEDLEGLVKGAFLVVAATGDSVLNEEIANAASFSGALTNSANGGSDVILPSVIEKNNITIGISTGGKSPAMARYLRKKIESALGRDVEAMVRLQEEVRTILKEKVPEQAGRGRVLEEILDDGSIWALLPENYERALEEALKKV